ncbi:hypothetical protein KSS87_009718 [Heliosperma pusillum]|nr:hypothetical protein KSS87_009718 [Heliosperma pusillum]
MVRASSSTTTLALGLLLMTLVSNCYGELRLNYYRGKCGKVNVEEAAFYIVKQHYTEDKDTVADLIRLQFHDCFVRVRRKDGRISNAVEAQNALPGSNIPVSSAINLFAQFGLNTEDFVVLLGCHTVGTAHCPSFEDRLYNYQGANGRSDPTINPTFLAQLKRTCPRGVASNNQAFLDQTRGSEFVMDNGYFKRILEGKGTLKIDQAIAYDPQTTKIVQSLAYNPTLFGAKIGPAMRKMAKIGVILNGEVRLGTCTRVRK